VDIAARYSDDLFAVLWPKTNSKEAFHCAERMRTTIDEHFHSYPTVSIGIAAYPEHALAEEALIAAARQALAEAKLRGHNKTVVCYKNEIQPLKDSTKILIVDDDDRNLKLLEALLRFHKYDVAKAYNGEEALSAMREHRF